VLGIVISLLLLPATILGQAAVTDQVDATAETVDVRLGQGIPLVESAASGVDTVIVAAQTVADTATSVAETGGSLRPVLEEVETFSDAYSSFRSRYQATTATLSAAVDSVEAIATLLPVGAAQSLHDALSGLEERVQELESSVADLLDAPGAGVAQVAETIAERAHQVEAALTAVAGSLDETAAQLQRTRETVSVRAAEISLAVTGLAVAICAWLIYTAILDWVLLTTTRRRPTAGP
jgi:ABC-type transporter Mla subunit MlaD